MPVLSRSLLLYLVLAVAALLTWMLARDSERNTGGSAGSPARPPQGYYLTNAVLSASNDDGVTEFRVDAGRVEHESNGSDLRLEEVRVEYSGNSDVAWQLNAARGTMTPDRERLKLLSMRLRAQTNTQGDGESQSFVFESSELDLDLRSRTASTEQTVRLRKDQCESNARGLNVDLNSDTFELVESETTCRRRPSPAPAIVFALVAGSAIAQDDPEGRITKICAGETGDLITNVYTCANATVTDNESFRLTFGFGTVSDERGLVFEQIEWRLTEGVRLEFETAVMVAESASLIWDGDGMLRSFDLVGTPTEFSDIIEGRTNPIRVTAPRIVYDGEAGTLKVPGAFEFQEDGKDGTWGRGCGLTYWLEEKRYETAPLECPSVLSLAPTATKDGEVTTIDEP